jgi:hypothetical protein
MAKFDPQQHTKLDTLLTLLPMVIVALAIYWGFASLSPSSVAYANGGDKQFSQQNALNHLKIISEKPHFLGSQAHGNVRQYLVDEIKEMGIEVNIFEQMATHSRYYYNAGKSKNIVAKFPGKSADNALVLMSHYDSGLHSSLGASDAGSGVVTILEGVRTFLANGETPQNDIILLFTDGEELGLLGAQAFVNFHPWASNIKVALNFEARGSGGPSYMILETNGGNARLVEAFSKANLKHPAANSLMYSIYKLLPNDTDLTIFREDADIQGYNFAFIDDHFDYHTQQDSFQRLDRESLNHQAEYLVALLDYFSNADLNLLRSDTDLVYFNFPGIGMVNYPFSWVLAMTVIAFLLLLPVTYVALKRKRVSVKAIYVSFVPLILSLTTAAAIGYFGWQILLWLFPQYADIPQNFTYNGYWIIASFVSFIVATTLVIYQYFKKHCTSISHSISAIILWLLMNIAIAIALPGAGFLVMPVFFALTGLYLLVFYGHDGPNKRIISLLTMFLALPIIMLLAPFILALIVGLGLNAIAIGTVFTCLLVVIVAPMLLKTSEVSHLRNLMLLLSAGFMVISIFESGYSPDRKKPNSINYIVDNDNKSAYWTSSNRTLDDFTQPFFSTQPSLLPWRYALYPHTSRSQVRHYQQTLVLPLAAAEISITKNSVDGTQRHISLVITPKRPLHLIQLATFQHLEVKKLSVNGQVFTKHGVPIENTYNNGFFFKYIMASPLEELNLDISIVDNGEVSLKVFETAFDLFERFTDIKPRDEIFMPEPFMVNDATIIGQTLVLPE